MQVILGRTSAGTLRLRQDERGLWSTIDLPSTQPARDLLQSVKRGDVRGQSFAFTDSRSSWTQEAGVPIRTVEAVELLEISPVAVPAYPARSLAARLAPPPVRTAPRFVAYRPARPA
jgi:HK97 family phage prohead protease